MKKRLCIYHNDSDGRMSAAIYKKHLINLGVVEECKFIEASHEKKKEIMKEIFPHDKEEEMFDEIVILDFSFDNSDMDHLRHHSKSTALNEWKNFIWIDHHISAKESYPGLWGSNNTISGIRAVEQNGEKISGAQLTWSYFHGEDLNYTVDLVGDYDTWTFKYEDHSRHFAEANRYYSVEEFQKILDNHPFFEEELLKGKMLYEDKLKRVDSKISGDYIKEISFHGYKTGLCNNSEYFDASLLGNTICEKGFDIALTYAIKKECVIFSLRSIKDEFDVGRLAMRMGGGGHAKASGFVRPLQEGLDLIKELCDRVIVEDEEEDGRIRTD